MKRVLIVGTSGVGKTTLGLQIAQVTGLPNIHLDILAWTKGWVRKPQDDFERELDEALAGEAWVIDGNYIKSLPQRAGRADTLILIDLPLWHCLVRVFRRWWKNRGKQRLDLPEGCLEPLPWTFLKWVLSAPPRHQQVWHDVAAANPHVRFYHFTSARQVDDFVKELKDER
ncbi:MAG: AAA family ATPase [Alphaproteobacteria bacterium]|nr:MAG: AAA family ATPase [Alphaproteobacteria bacterium]